MKPSEQHLRCLREHIELCQVSIAALTTIISSAQEMGEPLRQQQLPALQHRYSIAQLQIKTCRDAISPIHWIPNEILGEIFSHCLPLDRRFSRFSAPLLLLQVCRLWCDVAISTRSFWSSMAFWKPPSNTDILCYPLRFLSGWLLLSGRNSLDLFFEESLTYNHLKPLVELVLLAHYSQLRHLDLHLTKESAFALVHFVVLPPGSLENLESLVLEGLDEADFAFEEEGPLITVFQNSPRLRKLTTNALEFTYTFNNSTTSPEFDLSILPWAQLTHLMVTDFIRVDVFAIVLAECSALQFLRISLTLESHDEFMDVERWLPKEPVILSNLVELYLSLANGLSIPSLLDVFNFPALEHLHIRRSESGRLQASDSFSWASSRAFLLQLQSLRRLSLVGRVGTAPEVMVLLKSAPLVTHLALDIWTEYQTLIPALFPPLDAPLTSPLRLLGHLTLRLERSDFPFPSHCIRNAIDSAQCPLMHLTIICHRAACPKRLNELSNDLFGLPLQIILGVRSGPISRTARVAVDRTLMNDVDTSRDYTMLNPTVAVAVKYSSTGPFTFSA